MAQDLPAAADLLDAVAEFLRDDVLESLEGRAKFHTRVSVNVLGIVARELRESPALQTAEHERLTSLLGHEGSLEDLNSELAKAIRAGTLDADMDAVTSHVRQTVKDKLKVANPDYL